MTIINIIIIRLTEYYPYSIHIMYITVLRSKIVHCAEICVYENKLF